MRARLMVWLVALAVLILSAPLAEGAEYKIDLAGGDQQVSVPAKTVLAIRIVNMLPASRDDYKITVEHRLIPIPELQALTGETRAFLDGCPELEAAGVALAQAETEAGVRDAAEKLRKAMQETTGCDAEQTAARTLLAATEQAVATQYVLAAGEELVIKVSRQGKAQDGKESTFKWTVVLTTGARGVWQMSYGFAFLPNEDELAFTEAASNAQGTVDYTIRPERDRDSLDFAPTVFATWLPAKFAGRNFSFGPAGGLGFDMENPTVMLGAHLTYNQNLGVMAGAAVHRCRRLAGQYDYADVVHENLKEDQLHEMTYKATWFAAVTFRFDSNPFKKGEAGKD